MCCPSINWFSTFACSPAARRMPVASYMTTHASVNAMANSGESSHHCRQPADRSAVGAGHPAGAHHPLKAELAVLDDVKQHLQRLSDRPAQNRRPKDRIIKQFQKFIHSPYAFLPSGRSTSPGKQLFSQRIQLFAARKRRKSRQGAAAILRRHLSGAFQPQKRHKRHLPVGGVAAHGFP